MVPVLAIVLIVFGIADDLGQYGSTGVFVAAGVGILLTACLAWGRNRENPATGGD